MKVIRSCCFSLTRASRRQPFRLLVVGVSRWLTVRLVAGCRRLGSAFRSSARRIVSRWRSLGSTVRAPTNRSNTGHWLPARAPAGGRIHWRQNALLTACLLLTGSMCHCCFRCSFGCLVKPEPLLSRLAMTHVCCSHWSVVDQWYLAGRWVPTADVNWKHVCRQV